MSPNLNASLQISLFPGSLSKNFHLLRKHANITRYCGKPVFRNTLYTRRLHFINVSRFVDFTMRWSVSDFYFKRRQKVHLMLAQLYN